VVTTLHTILCQPSAEQRRVFQELCTLSARLVVMSECGKGFLQDIYNVPADKIDLNPHGIPDMPFVDPHFFKDRFGVEGKQVLLTFGLLSPNKGIEYVLQALPPVVRRFPDLVYVVVGATHPNLVREQGEAYRLYLERMVKDLGLSSNVVFYNRFVELSELKEFLGASDIYVTPYLNEAQITSGTLAYAFGCGKAVISTPYWHAKELLADDCGVLVPFADSAGISAALCSLLEDPLRRHVMRKKAYLIGRDMVWSNVAHLYMESFKKARLTRHENIALTNGKLTLPQRWELPEMRYTHLLRMSDSTGIFQHARYDLPRFVDGYCVDDNVRALLLTVMLESAGYESEELQRAASAYAAFVEYAFVPEARMFRNFMSFDRRWLEDCGSEDCQGRALWALGTCVGRSKRPGLRTWAAQLFDEALRAIVQASSPRAWAFALLGIHEYFRCLDGDLFVDQVRRELTDRLITLYEKHATADWSWFEPILAYANAKLPHALILSGRWGENRRAFEIGLESLQWLARLQTAEAGHFRPIGSDGFYRRNEQRADFDQQPIEAHAMISACIEAYAATNDHCWFEEARKAFEWFTGRNDLGIALFDARTGGCRDALHTDRVNENQGAESTVAFLLSLVEMTLLESSLSAFLAPVETSAPAAPRQRQNPAVPIAAAVSESAVTAAALPAEPVPVESTASAAPEPEATAPEA